MSIKKEQKLTFFSPDFESETQIPYITEGVSAGFPSPAADFMETCIDLNKELSENPLATFYIKVKGNSMIDAGIFDGDLLAVHRCNEARNGQIVVARLDEDVTVKRFRKQGAIVELIAENPDFQPIVVDTRQHPVAIEGVAVGLIRSVGGL